jgi:transposase
MDVVYRRCCGLDVHKQSITACVLLADGKAGEQVRKKEFGTFTRALQQLKMWLYACKVTHIAMESTGVYWKPVWNILEGHFEILLVNPQHIKAVPGRKTDQKDSEWIAELLQHGLLRPSFVPPLEIRQLRDFTRSRVQLHRDRNRIHNRIHRVLEDANIKLDCVATDILGVSGRRMIQAMIDGKEDAGWLADYARSRMRSKKPQLTLALQGRVTDHHRFLLRVLLEQLDLIEAQIAVLEVEIRRQLDSYSEVISRLCEIPGIDEITAWSLIAEIGLRMEQFPSADHLVSWAGLCPGSFESAGKRMSSRTRKGNMYVRRCLCQAAWAASHTKDTYLQAVFHRVTVRRGHKKAILALARHLLVIVFHLIAEGTRYRELGGDYFDRLHPDRSKNRLVRRLHRLGYEVTLTAQTGPVTQGSGGLNSSIGST